MIAIAGEISNICPPILQVLSKGFSRVSLGRKEPRDSAMLKASVGLLTVSQTQTTEENMRVMMKVMEQTVMTSADHHEAAANYHDEAAESHRNAAAYYAYGDYQQAIAEARRAKNHGAQAEEHCSEAMK